MIVLSTVSQINVSPLFAEDEGCPATTAEPYEMTSEGATEESTNEGTTESPEDVTVWSQTESLDKEP